MNPPNAPSRIRYGNPPRTRQTRQELNRHTLYMDHNKRGIKGGHKGDIGDFAELTEIYQIESRL